jgi:hypothetical protein
MGSIPSGPDWSARSLRTRSLKAFPESILQALVDVMFGNCVLAYHGYGVNLIGFDQLGYR